MDAIIAIAALCQVVPGGYPKVTLEEVFKFQNDCQKKYVACYFNATKEQKVSEIEKQKYLYQCIIEQ